MTLFTVGANAQYTNMWLVVLTFRKLPWFAKEKYRRKIEILIHKIKLSLPKKLLRSLK